MARRSQVSWKLAGVLIGTALLAWVASMGVGRLTAGLLALPDDATLVSLDGSLPLPDREVTGSPPPPGPSLASTPRRRDAASWVDPIVERNIFDSSKVGGTAELEDGVETGKTDLKVVLLATIVAEPEHYSSALIAEEKSEDGAVGYGIGDNLLGEATIRRIEQKRVIIERSDGTIEHIAMGDDSKYTRDKKATGKTATKEGEDDEVTKIGDNKYIVDQELVDRLMENPEKLYNKIRAVPHKTDGEVDGYRLSGIRRKSVFAQLGVKNGDIVHTVNGRQLTSLSAAMDAFNSLQNDKDFSFDITRRNQRQTMEYEIR